MRAVQVVWATCKCLRELDIPASGSLTVSAYALFRTRPLAAPLAEKNGMDDADLHAAGDMPILPDLLDLSTAAAVRQMLLDRRGADLALDASNVRKVSAVGLQVVISAARTWQADGHDFRIETPTRQMRDAFDIMGFDTSGLCETTGGSQ